MAARHEVVGGKVQVYKRPGGRYWQCSTSIGGRQVRGSTKKEELSQAEDFAEDWYLELRGKFKRGEAGVLRPVNAEKTFSDAAEQFLREFSVITEGQRSPIYVKGHERRVRKWLVPFFGDKPLSEVTAGLIQDFRIHRLEQAKAKWGKPPGGAGCRQS